MRPTLPPGLGVRSLVSMRDDLALMSLVRECHPGRPPRSLFYFAAYPTFVIAEGDGAIVAYTQLCMMPFGGPLMVHGIDLGVHPAHRRQGLARALVSFRLALGAKLGAIGGYGMTEPDNTAMRALFESEGWCLL
ncbi:MAG TPA: GNAT family N-acetyltransferase, partial [Candidatus Polarisedimenticolia bacterium]|nr:GNAT family N-acetyltransferase [Candidatus Polarisedimenticolia bacterium]